MNPIVINVEDIDITYPIGCVKEIVEKHPDHAVLCVVAKRNEANGDTRHQRELIFGNGRLLQQIFAGLVMENPVFNAAFWELVRENDAGNIKIPIP